MPLTKIWDAFKGRLDTPIVGNYLLTLILLNWKILLYVFSGSESPTWRVCRIQEYISSNTFYFNFLYALLLLAFYLYIVPFITTGIKVIHTKVLILEQRSTVRLASQLDSEKNVGGQFEVLASGLKNELRITVAEIKELALFIRQNGAALDNHQHDKSFKDLLSRMESHADQNADLLNHHADIFNSELNRTPLEQAKRSYVNRHGKPLEVEKK